MIKESRKDFDEAIEMFHSHTADNGLSVVAFDNKTNGLVGTFTAFDVGVGSGVGKVTMSMIEFFTNDPSLNLLS